MRSYREMVIARDGVSPTQKQRPAAKLPCIDCGTVVGSFRDPTSPRCSPCGRAFHAMQKRMKRRPERARRKIAKAAAGVPANRRWPWFQGDCAYCGDWFTRRGQASPYCSSRCRKKDRPSGSWISKRKRLAIYERDDWTCQLCSEPVDPDLHYLDDWAASLDHIVCRSWSEEPDHSPENLRLTHRWCNSVRGDESHYDESVLRRAA